MTFQVVPATRERILSEAERLFAGSGYDGVSMREIAEASAVTKANIYYYFKDKESLYLEILKTDIAALVAALDEAASADGSCRERVTRLATTFWELMQAKNALIQLSLRQFGGLEREMRGLVVGYQDEMVRPIVSVLADGINKGELRPLDPRVAAVSLMGMLSIFVASHLLDIPMRQSPQEAVSQTVDLFFEGAAALRCETPLSRNEPA